MNKGTEQFFEAEFDKARERGGETYAMAYIKGLRDGYDQCDKIQAEIMVELLKWFRKLPPSEMISLWSKSGECQGIFNMDEQQLVDKFINRFSNHPRPSEGV